MHGTKPIHTQNTFDNNNNNNNFEVARNENDDNNHKASKVDTDNQNKKIYPTPKIGPSLHFDAIISHHTKSKRRTTQRNSPGSTLSSIASIQYQTQYPLHYAIRLGDLCTVQKLLLKYEKWMLIILIIL
jgi:hypothetical protein